MPNPEQDQTDSVLRMARDAIVAIVIVVCVAVWAGAARAADRDFSPDAADALWLALGIMGPILALAVVVLVLAQRERHAKPEVPFYGDQLSGDEL